MSRVSAAPKRLPGALDAVANALGVGAGKLLAALLGAFVETSGRVNGWVGWVTLGFAMAYGRQLVGGLLNS